MQIPCSDYKYPAIWGSTSPFSTSTYPMERGLGCRHGTGFFLAAQQEHCLPPVLVHQPLSLFLLLHCHVSIPHLATNEIFLIHLLTSLPFSKKLTDFSQLTGYSLHTLVGQTRFITNKPHFFVQFYLQTFPLHILRFRHVKLFSTCHF